MKSDLPKPLHPICGKPMLWHVMRAVTEATREPPVLVVGHGAEQVREFVGDAARFVVQEERLGTGHAVQQTESLLRGKTEYLLVVSADMPLLTPETFRALIETQQKNEGTITMLSFISDTPRGFGRVIRDEKGFVQAIVEEADATPEQRKIRELNAGAYCFSAEWLWDALKRVPLSPKGEYYLTDVIALAVADSHPVRALTLEDASEALGINTRIHLAEAEAAMRQRVNRRHMLAGVTIVDPQTTYIEMGVQIGRDTVILPGTMLHGNTTIGERCEIGPNAVLRDTRVGNDCRIFLSVLEYAAVENHVEMGPFVHLRKGAHLMDRVHMGNFGEVKNSTLGPGVKMGHFSYIGDAVIGAETNIGAGTITCNYDGERKHKTEIGEEVFIGSDTMLVAPLKIGDRARTGAGSVVTKDVKADTLVVGVPARAIRNLKNE
jgi:bifunctional UDP-N-acetylglucosamine pyrophosphorylase/glucosamine-1-phosphate N-acetyltransferase